MPADLERRIYTAMRVGRNDDKAVLDGFSERLLTLFERKEGKPLGEMKETLKGQVSVVMEALIDTVLSPQFSQMLACGFLEDDEIAEEVMGAANRCSNNSWRSASRVSKRNHKICE